MPRATITQVTVSHFWDDESRTDFDIALGSPDDSGPRVSVQEGQDVIVFRTESWPEIRNQIDTFFDVAEGDQ